MALLLVVFSEKSEMKVEASYVSVFPNKGWKLNLIWVMGNEREEVLNFDLASLEQRQLFLQAIFMVKQNIPREGKNIKFTYETQSTPQFVHCTIYYTICPNNAPNFLVGPWVVDTMHSS